jgi:hypothetical protein
MHNLKGLPCLLLLKSHLLGCRIIQLSMVCFRIKLLGTILIHHNLHHTIIRITLPHMACQHHLHLCLHRLQVHLHLIALKVFLQSPVEEFCSRYGLESEIEQALARMKFWPGPTLSSLTESDWKEVGLAKLQYARVVDANNQYRDKSFTAWQVWSI